MIDRTHKLPVSKQVKALGMSRGCVYYPAKPISKGAQTLPYDSDRSIACGTAFCRRAHAPGSVATGGRHGGPQSCRDADAAYGP